MSKAPRYVHLNGRLVAAEKARVSALDHGLLYGDGLFETVRTYRGVAFALEEHVARLHNSGHLLGIVLPKIDWAQRIRALLERIPACYGGSGQALVGRAVLQRTKVVAAPCEVGVPTR